MNSNQRNHQFPSRFPQDGGRRGRGRGSQRRRPHVPRRASREGAKRRSPSAPALFGPRLGAKDTCPGLSAIGRMGLQRGSSSPAIYGVESKPKELRKLLDANAVKCCGTHTGIETVTGERAQGHSPSSHSILGNTFLIVPSLQGEARQGWLDWPRGSTRIGHGKELGMRVRDHAHAGDFPASSADTTS